MNDSLIGEKARAYYYTGAILEEHAKRLPHPAVVELILVGSDYNTHLNHILDWLNTEVPGGQFDANSSATIGGRAATVAWFAELSQAIAFKLRWTGTIE